MLRKLLISIISILASVSANASIYTWSQYNLTFEVPDNGFVSFSSNTHFEIQWEDMVMTIQLYNKDKSDDKFLKENLQRKAMGYNMYDLKHGKSKVKGFKGLNISGTMPDGSRAIIADLISKKQDLIVEITINYLYGNIEVVEDIIKSFAENKTQKPNQEKKRQRVQTKEEAEKQKREDSLKKKQPEQPKRDEGPLFNA